MNRPGFISLLLILALTAFASCTKHVYPVVYDGSKADATVTMYYEYTRIERPVVHWERARKEALTRCRNWGYTNTEFFEAGIEDCIRTDADGDCWKWRVYFTCQCLD